MRDEDIERWITVHGRHVPILKGESEEDALKRFYGNFDDEDEEINLETDDLDNEIENKLVTISYFQPGFGNISKKGYDALKARGEEVQVKVTETPVDNLPYGHLKKHEDIKTASSKVNPLFKTNEYEWTYNCQRCVVALEMRIRGYDVTAKPRLQDDDIFKDGSAWNESWKGFEWKSSNYYYPGDNAASAAVFEREMIKEGEGARFVMYIQWRKHSWQDKAQGHTLIGIVQNGQVNYYDPQKGKKANSWKYKCNPAETMYARIDNLHMTDKVKNCVYNKGEQPTVKSLSKGWITKEEADEGYERI